MKKTVHKGSTSEVSLEINKRLLVKNRSSWEDISFIPNESLFFILLIQLVLIHLVVLLFLIRNKRQQKSHVSFKIVSSGIYKRYIFLINS